jgi:thiamine biosynthesis lipoprotein
MRETRLLMGMPITVEIVDPSATQGALDSTFAFFGYVDEKFSTYKPTSEISQINEKKLLLHQASPDMRRIFALAERTKQETFGYFDIFHNGHYDPSGIVKGWAIYHAAKMLCATGFTNFYVDAGGDVQAFGNNADGEPWRVGIRNPFNDTQIVKVLSIMNRGVATSGTYVRGQHIYNPNNQGHLITDIVSLTVIGPDIYEADRFATAAFAMGSQGILFIESLHGFEGYMIDKDGIATMTSGFEDFVK